MSRTGYTSDGKLIATTWPTEGSRKTIVTPNWCDKTTWHHEASQVTEETPTEFTSLTVYDLANTNVIDSYHGKLWSEEETLTAYRVLVETSPDGTTWTPKTEEDPHVKHVTGQNGDYIIDYAAGRITFHSALPSGEQVRVSYWYANGSCVIIEPLPGKKLSLVSAEAQFSDDIEMRDSITFQAWGYVDYFAPALLTTADPPGPYPPGTKIPISTTRYKTMMDFYNEANGAQPAYPALGGNNWRGVGTPVVVFQWDYAALMPLAHAAGMEVRICLEHEEQLGGTYATATIYALSEDE